MKKILRQVRFRILADTGALALPSPTRIGWSGCVGTSLWDEHLVPYVCCASDRLRPVNLCATHSHRQRDARACASGLP